MPPYPFAYNPYSDTYISGELLVLDWTATYPPISVFPTGPQDSVFPMFAQNDTSVPIISTGVHFNHSYTSSQVSPSPDAYSSSYYVPNNYK